MSMDEQWAREHVGTTPSVGGCGTSYHDERGDVQDCTSVEPCRACLRRRIAQLEAQRGGAVVVPEYPENSFDVRMAVQKAGGMADFDQGIFRAGWEFLASRIQPIPAGRVLGKGMVGVDRGTILGAIEMLDLFCREYMGVEDVRRMAKERVDHLRGKIGALRSPKGEVVG